MCREGNSLLGHWKPELVIRSHRGFQCLAGCGLILNLNFSLMCFLVLRFNMSSMGLWRSGRRKEEIQVTFVFLFLSFTSPNLTHREPEKERHAIFREHFNLFLSHADSRGYRSVPQENIGMSIFLLCPFTSHISNLRFEMEVKDSDWKVSPKEIVN